MNSSTKDSPILIIDGFGFIFRAYHVQPPLSAPDGMPVGAIYGFTSMLIKLIGDLKPQNAVIVLDHSGPNFRHELYDEYKANRPPAPDDLIAQLKIVESAAKAMNFTCISKQGYEADDIIATIASKASNEGRKAVVISSDKDLMQLVDKHVSMYDPAKSKYIEEEDIVKKFGVGANRVRDVQALMGDKSDNIPGVAGIGPKTASQLINEFGNFHELLDSINKVSKPRLQNLLTEYKDDALLSWQLVGLDENVELSETLDDFGWQPPKPKQISEFLNRYGFRSLNKRVENLFKIQVEQAEEAGIEHEDAKKNILVINQNIKEISSFEEAGQLISEIKINGYVALHHTTQEKDLILFLNSGGATYEVNYSNNSSQEVAASDLFNFAENNNSSNNQDDKLIKTINALLTNKSIKKIGYQIKDIMHDLDQEICAYEDIQIMDYLLSAGKKAKSLLEVIHHYSENEPISEKHYVAYFNACYEKLYKQLILDKTLHLYNDIDRPLAFILYKMEREGVKIDASILQNLSSSMGDKIESIEQKIYNLAGKEFNIASPKQLGEVLFDDLKLPYAKTSGKSKSYSTNADILEKLAGDGYEIASLLLDFRHLTKLKNTYTDALPRQINEKTGRVHTSFMQCATSTGRLSSVNPNIQNIPIRTKDGNKIRSAFVAEDGNVLISADYSQIELRILSHVAKISTLKDAFDKGADIHAITASQIFDLPIEDISSEIRRSAKAINFGIIYGISAFGLAKQLGIPRKEAAEYIEKYFQKYPGIKQYMSDIVEYSKSNEYIANELGRKCFLPNINSKNHLLRNFAERAAINAPMQSLASDIVKIAMIKLQKILESQNFKAKIILQIHDELIIEAPAKEQENLLKIIKDTMENAINLTVKTSVDISYGGSWMDL